MLLYFSIPNMASCTVRTAFQACLCALPACAFGLCTLSLVNDASGGPTLLLVLGVQSAPCHRAGVASFVTSRHVFAGEELCISYIIEDADVATRRQHLQWAYGFTCQCELCREQTEEQ